MWKFVSVILLVFLLCAFSWPPESYEMPRTVLDSVTVEESLSGLRSSMGAIANTGLILIGILTSVSLISTIFKRLFLDKIDSLHSRNYGSQGGRKRSSSDVGSQVRERDLGHFGRHGNHRGSNEE